MKEYIKQQIQSSINLMSTIYDDYEILEQIHLSINAILTCYRNGGKVLVAGNGGSAADAQHIAGELINRLYFDRPALSCIALTTDTSVLTAIGNDYSYEKVFSKQIAANGKKGDVFIGISTSGNSVNIVEALKLCGNMGIVTIGLTGGMSGIMEAYSNYLIKVLSIETPKIQESHMVIYHIMCGIIEESIFGKKHFK